MTWHHANTCKYPQSCTCGADYCNAVEEKEKAVTNSLMTLVKDMRDNGYKNKQGALLVFADRLENVINT